jgi:hypothetical protein
MLMPRMLAIQNFRIIKIDDGQTDQPRYNLVQNISIKDAYDDATLSNLSQDK